MGNRAQCEIMDAKKKKERNVILTGMGASLRSVVHGNVAKGHK